MTDKDYGSELDDLFAEMELKSQLAPDAYARKVAIDETKAKLSALLRRVEVDTLKQPNGLLRTAYQITEREEFYSLFNKPHTNWNGFKKSLLKELEREHKIMYPKELEAEL